MNMTAFAVYCQTRMRVLINVNIQLRFAIGLTTSSAVHCCVCPFMDCLAFLTAATLLKVGSHCRSDQLDRPGRPNSLTNYLDQARPLLGRLVRVLFSTESTGVWSCSDRVPVELIGYCSVQKCYTDHTRSPHDHFPINPTSRPNPITSRSLLERLPTRLLLDFFDSQK